MFEKKVKWLLLLFVPLRRESKATLSSLYIEELLLESRGKPAGVTHTQCI